MKLERRVPLNLQYPPAELSGVIKQNLILNGRRMSAMMNVLSCQECTPIRIAGINTTIADSVTIAILYYNNRFTEYYSKNPVTKSVRNMFIPN